MASLYQEWSKEGSGQGAALQAQCDELHKRLDGIEEKYFVTGEMTRETFKKFSFKFQGEQATISMELDGLTKGSSNPIEAFRAKRKGTNRQ